MGGAEPGQRSVLARAYSARECCRKDCMMSQRERAARWEALPICQRMDVTGSSPELALEGDSAAKRQPGMRELFAGMMSVHRCTPRIGRNPARRRWWTSETACSNRPKDAGHQFHTGALQQHLQIKLLCC